MDSIWQMETPGLSDEVILDRQEVQACIYRPFRLVCVGDFWGQPAYEKFYLDEDSDF